MNTGYMQRLRAAGLGIANFTMMLSSLSCDETLPAREEPQKFLSAALNVQPLIVRVDIDSNAQPPYPEVVSGTNGSLQLSLISYYNEVLQDQAEVHGTIDVWLADRPDVRTTVTMTVAEVDYPVFDPDGILTLIPGDSVHLAKQWSHIADNRQAFFRYGPLGRGFDPGSGRSYYESAPVRYNAQATLQVFQNVQAEKTPIYEFSLVYRIFVRYPP